MKTNQVLLNFEHKLSLRLKSAKDLADFFFLCGFLGALDLSAVPLYGDDCSITPSASNRHRPLFLNSRRTKATRNT